MAGPAHLEANDLARQIFSAAQELGYESLEFLRSGFRPLEDLEALKELAKKLASLLDLVDFTVLDKLSVNVRQALRELAITAEQCQKSLLSGATWDLPEPAVMLNSLAFNGFEALKLGLTPSNSRWPWKNGEASADPQAADGSGPPSTAASEQPDWDENAGHHEISSKLFPKGRLENRKAERLACMLFAQEACPEIEQKPKMAIAREITGESTESDSKAKSLVTRFDTLRREGWINLPP